LSSHEHKSEVKNALWELNRILKSIHILRDIDDPEYRRNIRTALNRGERYNGLIEEIQSVGGSDFRGKSEIEIEIWNECTRLIALIIIYYNMHLLNRLYEDALARNDQAAIEFLRRISPVASQHINIGGVYEIREAMENINVDDIVEFMSRILEDSIMTLGQAKPLTA
jgi:hypothetical protein